MNLKKSLSALAVTTLLFAAPAFAQSNSTWDQLTPAQRDVLTAQAKERWNAATPDQRTKMVERAGKWNAMTPEQRAAARKGRHAWGQMTPERREAMRAVAYKVQNLPQDQRKAFFEQFRAMTPEQKAAWVKANPVPAGAEVKMPMRNKGMGMRMHKGMKGMKGAPAPMTPPPAK